MFGCAAHRNRRCRSDLNGTADDFEVRTRAALSRLIFANTLRRAHAAPVCFVHLINRAAVNAPLLIADLAFAAVGMRPVVCAAVVL